MVVRRRLRTTVDWLAVASSVPAWFHRCTDPWRAPSGAVDADVDQHPLIGSGGTTEGYVELLPGYHPPRDCEMPNGAQSPRIDNGRRHLDVGRPHPQRRTTVGDRVAVEGVPAGSDNDASRRVMIDRLAERGAAPGSPPVQARSASATGRRRKLAGPECSVDGQDLVVAHVADSGPGRCDARHATVASVHDLAGGGEGGVRRAPARAGRTPAPWQPPPRPAAAAEQEVAAGDDPLGHRRVPAGRVVGGSGPELGGVHGQGFRRPSA